ncbi:MAG TPA: ATP-binding protein [Aggregatilineaceae bacterium]|nr:ATP-binding protein [Aggregatilineaceae bacterium]
MEDGADVRRFLAEDVLGPHGYDVLTAADGAEGLTLARDLAPDLIIADYLMPHLDGLSMLAALRTEELDVPFILITAEGSEALAVQALQLRVSDYLVKPFEPEELLESVQHVLSEHWTRQITANIPDRLLQTNRQLEQRLRELDTLVQIGKQVTGMLDLQLVLNRVVEAAVALAHAEEGTLLLVDQPSGELYLYASSGGEVSLSSLFRLPVSDSLAGQVVRTCQPLVIAGDELQKIKTHYFFRSLVYVPLLLKNRAIGVLGVTNRQSWVQFEPHTLQLLSVLADFAAIAIENARLYAATEKERDTLNTVLRDTEDAIIVADPRTNILFCNPAACRTFNVDGDTCRGHPVASVIAHREVVELFEKEARTARSRHSEIVLGEGQRTLNAQLTMVKGVGRVVVMQDITHLKELDRIKSDFVTTVSHDLRSPLTGILGYVELLRRSGPLNEPQQKFVEHIVFSVESITTLITDLLELGQIEAGFDGDREPIGLCPIVQHAVESQRHAWESKRQTLRVDLSDHLPRVLGNRLRLRQMLTNLLENAVKYTPEAGRIRVSLEAEGDFLVLRVADTGIGIPPKDLPYIFDKFYRSDEAIDHFTGTGLGLSIVKGIVERHHGRVWVESQVGRGSLFTVMLPACGPDAAGDEPESPNLITLDVHTTVHNS